MAQHMNMKSKRFEPGITPLREALAREARMVRAGSKVPRIIYLDWDALLYGLGDFMAQGLRDGISELAARDGARVVGSDALYSGGLYEVGIVSDTGHRRTPEGRWMELAILVAFHKATVAWRERHDL